jgi:hypothetical protein
MLSCLPDERTLTWLALNLEKLGPAALARAVESVAQAVPVVIVMTSAPAPSNEAALSGVKDILVPPSGSLSGSLDANEPY